MIGVVPHRTVEQFTRFAPFGIRFWDSAEERQVLEGLRVTAQREGSHDRPSVAFRTASGAYAFQGLPGLRAVEWGEAPSSGPDVLALQQRFVVEIEDLQRRFVRAAFVLDLPREERGLYPSPPASSLPGDVAPGFMLFSAPTRLPSSGTAAIRADLENAATGEAAAYAVIAVEIEGETNYGIADGGGKVAVFFPYPAFRHSLSGSFPEGGQPLHDYTWSATVRVLFAPGTQVHLPEASAPLLGSLFDQAEGLLHAIVAESPPNPAPSLEIGVPFGRELILQSSGSSTFLIEPA